MMKTIARSLISSRSLTGSFYVYDMNVLQDNVNRWKRCLPQITPFYAVKCNPDEGIMRTLAANGTGFDCASKQELLKALTITNASNIIFAHPCKMMSDIKFADDQSIAYTTFDTLSEVEKLAKSRTSIPLLLRIKVDNPTAKVQLGIKYGIEVETECLDIIRFARSKNLNIHGVSFHVGSASNDPKIFDIAIQNSAKVFKMLSDVGYQPTLLNIGGGFNTSTFESSARVISDSIQTHIDQKLYPKLSYIAEPGRFFVENIATFFTPIIGSRFRNNRMEYWITDGIYGSFNCILYDHKVPEIDILSDDLSAKTARYESIIWGATCDSFDSVTKSVLLPKLEVGSWLVFKNFGAYTVSGAMDFNGINMSRPKIFYAK
jgi:ornithine decarboxylase